MFNVQILPTSKILSNLYTHLFFILIGFVITTANGYYPSLYSLQLIYYLACLLVFLTAITWITASTQPFLPDIMQFINIIMQTVMWTLPILWQPTGMIATILKINPLYYIVQGYRESYLGGAWFWEHWQYSLYFWGVTIVLLLIGSTVFRRLKPHFQMYYKERTTCQNMQSISNILPKHTTCIKSRPIGLKKRLVQPKNLTTICFMR